MAVSKTQNERPAINALIDLANGLETTSQQQASSIQSIEGSLASEVEARAQEDSSLAHSIQQEVTERESAITAEASARAASDAAIQNQLGAGFSSTNTVADFAYAAESDISSLMDFMESVKFGFGDTITVAANDDYDDVIVYENQFPDTSESFAFIALPSEVDQETLTLTLKSATNSGISYNVANSDNESVTLRIGYLAIKVDTLQ